MAAITAELKAEFHHFSGPLPPPEALARYNEVIPGGAERILAMAERQSAHREALESKVVNANASSQKMGSTYAFILSLVAIVGGVWLIHDGKSVTGLATILADLAALAGVFVVSRSKQAKERVQKSKALDQARRN
ncbi:MAG: DUF2335 domain-containing protein [Acidobacteriaceae bacterium]|jgi:uncharacterized membrane protein